ncbi:MAG: DUF2961 domain-containing protein [Chitinophagaceae bacterium]
MKRNRAYLLLFLFVSFYSNGIAQSTITLGSLLKEMTSFNAVAEFPFPSYTIRQASSYDRRSISPDKPGWFANADFNQFIREENKEGHKEYVMMDADGPGAIVRFWLTTVVKPGTMRFYFDNEQKASVVIPGFDLLRGFKLGPALLNPHSSYERDGKGGNTLYLPLLYQKHCKVTWEYADSATMKTSHYYQINYRTYAAGTTVETFSTDHLTKYKTEIDDAESKLWQPSAIRGDEIKLIKSISPGKEVSVSLPEGKHAIQVLSVHFTANKADYEKIWRSVLLKIEFDGKQTVLCPVGEFIGSGFSGKKIKSWYRDLSDSGTMICRWLMPYKKESKITFTNGADFPIEINTGITVSSYNWTDRSMYFHVTYKFEQDIKDAKWDYDLTKVAAKDMAAPIDWNFAALKGKGVYLGNTLSVNNHMKSWYGEGDAKAYVDNENFPSEFGTGLEDYYNTSWAPVILYQTPFANAPQADQPSSTGLNTFTRTRILDGIPFTKTFSFDMEMLSWDGGTIDAAATTYWYGFDGSTDK